MLARAAVFLVVVSAWCVDGQMGPRWIVPAQKAMQAQSEGRWSDAAAHYAACLEAGVPAEKEVAVRTNLGLSLHSTGKYEEAIAAYDAVLALQPTYADCHHNKGNSLYKARRHAEAVAAFGAAIAIKPGDAESLFNQGNAYEQMEHHALAADAFSRSAQLDPIDANAWYNLGNAHKALGETEGALSAYARAAELHRVRKDVSALAQTEANAAYTLDAAAR